MDRKKANMQLEEEIDAIYRFIKPVIRKPKAYLGVSCHGHCPNLFIPEAQPITSTLLDMLRGQSSEQGRKGAKGQPNLLHLRPRKGALDAMQS